MTPSIRPGQESAVSDAFGMAAAAIVLTEEPWSVGDGREKPTPLCLVWDGWREAPDAVAPHAWIAGWLGESWPAVDAWKSGDSEVGRLEAYTLGVMARKVWEEASAKEHEPHRFNATIIRGQARCRCGAWASWEVEYNGKSKFTRRGRSKWAALDKMLARAHDPDVPLPAWIQDRIRDEIRPPTRPPEEPTTPGVDEVFAGRRRP